MSLSSAIWWSVLGLSLILNVADLFYDGLPIALMVLGACLR